MQIRIHNTGKNTLKPTTLVLRNALREVREGRRYHMESEEKNNFTIRSTHRAQTGFETNRREKNL
jgi:hypothetical protein